MRLRKSPTALTTTGRIVSFCPSLSGLSETRVELLAIDPEIHQIDWVDDRLLVTDTRNNRILEYERQGKALRLAREAMPLGKLADGSNSENYAHINSVFGCEGKLVLVCHNQTFKTGRPSELIELDRDLKLVSREKMEARCAHNFIASGADSFVCDSMGKRLLKNGNGRRDCRYFAWNGESGQLLAFRRIGGRNQQA